MAGLDDLNTLIGRLDEATAEARDATRELHSALKTARQMHRELDELARRCQDQVPGLVDKTMGTIIARELTHYTEVMQEECEAAAGRISDMFDRHMNLCLYGNAQGRGENVFEKLRQAVLRANLVVAAQNGMPPMPVPPSRRK
jgi:hypothetical protein